MKYLIVAPKYISNIGIYYDFPLGLAYISANLKNRGYEVECLNPNHYYEPMEQLLEREIKKKQIIGY